jgi:hypothetical protein
VNDRVVAVKVAHDEVAANKLLSEGWDLLTTFYGGHLPGYNPSVVFVLVMKEGAARGVVRLEEEEGVLDANSRGAPPGF